MAYRKQVLRHRRNSMIICPYPTPLHSSLKEFLGKILWIEESIRPICHSFSIDLFQKFQDGGCDYFDLLSVMAAVNSFSGNELDLLISLNPKTSKQMAVSSKSIRESIPRWTSSQHHTAPISQIVETIKSLLTGNGYGVTVFNSNLNLHNKRAVNDQYILIISEKHRMFFDINRKSSVCFDFS